MIVHGKLAWRVSGDGGNAVGNCLLGRLPVHRPQVPGWVATLGIQGALLFSGTKLTRRTTHHRPRFSVSCAQGPTVSLTIGP